MASREPRAPGGRNGTSGAGQIGLDLRFDGESLYALRAAVEAHAADLGAPPELVAHLVIIASELASNAVRHGGGAGRLRLSREDGALRCVVDDSGPGMTRPAVAGTSAPPPYAVGGRGLWIVRRLAIRTNIESTERGTTVTVLVPI
jgi:anti-sigma regulatory factor (Ser/Thr protein kinase)